MNSLPALDTLPRYRQAQRATAISALINALLSVAQIVVGWLAQSPSLLAHGLHSFSDLLSDFIVLLANRGSHVPADAQHPYGHRRFETLATLILGVSLIGVAGSVLWFCVQRLRGGEAVAADMLALAVAVATLLSKEALYRYLASVAGRLKSRLLLANALHTRADALSSLVVIAGVSGALLGYPILDVIAAFAMALMIGHLGITLVRDAAAELTDAGLDPQRLERIRQCLRDTEGVQAVESLRSRRMAGQVLLDSQLRVDGGLSVSEAHRIAHLARDRVMAAEDDVIELLVHVEPGRAASSPHPVPGRSDVLTHLCQSLGPDVAVAEACVLHYLESGVRVELRFGPDAPDSTRLQDMVRRLQAGRAQAPWLEAVVLCRRVAP